MNVEPTAIPDVLVITLRVFEDERGFFMETFQAERFAKAGLPTIFVQDNHSGSRRGTLRGLHYQIRHAQGKLIRVVIGEIFDVAVDLRRRSPTFGQWVGRHLSAQNRQMLWVPPGFAHGFYTLSEWAEVQYKTTDFYAPEWERVLRWDDPEINISWPLLDNQPPLLSARDRAGALLADAEVYETL